MSVSACWEVVLQPASTQWFQWVNMDNVSQKDALLQRRKRNNKPWLQLKKGFGMPLGEGVGGRTDGRKEEGMMGCTTTVIYTLCTRNEYVHQGGRTRLTTAHSPSM